jgi:uncharacterized protein
MKLKIQQIPENQPYQLELSEKDEWLKDTVRKAAEDGASLPEAQKAPIQCSLRFHKVRGNVHLEGRLIAKIPLLCSRKAKSFGFPLDRNFNITFLVNEKKASLVGAEVQPEEDHADFVFLEEDIIDLSAVLNEQILLELPYRPLCDEALEELKEEPEDSQMVISSSNKKDDFDSSETSPFAALRDLSIANSRGGNSNH